MAEEQAPEEPLSAADVQALASFRYAIRRFTHFSERTARAAGIEPQQHQLLLAISGLPPHQVPNVKTLTERMQLRQHSVVELLNRLERRGLIERTPHPADRRQVLVRLTAEGDALLQHLARFHRRELRLAGPALIASLNAIINGQTGSAGHTELAHQVNQQERSSGE